MNGECQQKRGKPLFKYAVILMTVLLLCSFPLIFNRGEAICKDLKPYKNIDELLYQFYVNIDSDCLFEMPVAELEKIWDTKILSEERVGSNDRYSLRMSSDFKNKPYRSEKDAFFIEIERSTYDNDKFFRVIITEEYYRKYATLFPDGNFPTLIPFPDKSKVNVLPILPLFGQDKPHLPRKTGGYRLQNFIYYWLSADQTRKITLEGLYGVRGFTMEHKLVAGSINNNLEQNN